MEDDSEPEETAAVTAALRKMGLLRMGEAIALSPLGGGVSCAVYRAEIAERVFCVKRALPKLRVEAEWLAPAERAASEVAWFGLVSALEPDLVPRVLGEDRALHLFVMEYLPPDTYPVWKSELAHGAVDAGFAARVGAAVARIHAATASRADIAAQFANATQFLALRIEPYLLYSAAKHPEVRDVIRAMAQGLESSRVALMHGDISPKNILCGPCGPVFLDAETACYGDPAFDLAFCLNHLLLKCVWHPRWIEGYLAAFAALKSAYLERVDWEDASALETRTARLLPALLLGRVDGKSPVEYLNEENDKALVREGATTLMRCNFADLGEIASRWRDIVRTCRSTERSSTS